MATVDRVLPVLREALSGSGLVLEDVTVTPAGKRRVVRVLVDRDLGDVDTVTEVVPPLSLDEVGDATGLVGDALDTADVLGEQPYTLEVSSPGVGRPLTEPRHFQRNVGRLLTVTTAEGDVGGRLVAADRDGLTLASGGPKTPTTERTLGYDDVQRAVVEVEFGRPTETKES